MDLDGVLERDTLFDQELQDVASVVTLKLDDCAPLFVLHSGAVAAPGLLERAQDLLQVQIVGHALHQGQALAGRALLEMQVYAD